MEDIDLNTNKELTEKEHPEKDSFIDNKFIKRIMILLVILTVLIDVICINNVFAKRTCIICNDTFRTYGNTNYSKTDVGYMCEKCAIEYYNQGTDGC